MKDSEKAFDNIDKGIISILNGDGRLGSNEIARQLGVSEGTVRNRMKRLVDEGVLKVSGLVNPDFLPDKHLAILEIKAAVSKDIAKIADRISHLPGVVSVYVITGRMDIMVEVFVDTKSGLMEFIGTHLASIEGVVSTESHVVMKHYNKWLPSGDVFN